MHHTNDFNHSLKGEKVVRLFNTCDKEIKIYIFKFHLFLLLTFRSSPRHVDPPDDPAHGEFMEEGRPGSQVQWEPLFAAAVDAFAQGAPLD